MVVEVEHFFEQLELGLHVAVVDVDAYLLYLLLAFIIKD